MAVLVYDLTLEFCSKFVDKSYKSDRSYGWNRQADQMIQAARSGKQNIAEGSSASRASRKNEIKLVNVARASLSELLADYEDFLRQNHLKQWDKNSPQALRVRNLHKTNQTDKSDKTDRSGRTDQADKSYTTYKSYMTDSESAANALICLINQTAYLLDRQLLALEKTISEKGEIAHKQMSYKERLLAKIKEDDEFLAKLTKKHGL